MHGWIGLWVVYPCVCPCVYIFNRVSLGSTSSVIDFEIHGNSYTRLLVWVSDPAQPAASSSLWANISAWPKQRGQHDNVRMLMKALVKSSESWLGRTCCTLLLFEHRLIEKVSPCNRCRIEKKSTKINSWTSHQNLLGAESSDLQDEIYRKKIKKITIMTDSSKAYNSHQNHK